MQTAHCVISHAEHGFTTNITHTYELAPIGVLPETTVACSSQGVKVAY